MEMGWNGIVTMNCNDKASKAFIADCWGEFVDCVTSRIFKMRETLCSFKLGSFILLSTAFKALLQLRNL